MSRHFIDERIEKFVDGTTLLAIARPLMELFAPSWNPGDEIVETGHDGPDERHNERRFLTIGTRTEGWTIEDGVEELELGVRGTSIGKYARATSFGAPGGVEVQLKCWSSPGGGDPATLGGVLAGDDERVQRAARALTAALRDEDS